MGSGKLSGKLNESLTKCLWGIWDELVSQTWGRGGGGGGKGNISLLLVTSCYGNQDQFWLDGPLGLVS